MEYGIQTVPDSVPADMGNTDKIGHTVAESIQMAMDRAHNLFQDTIGMGSTIGDQMPTAEVLPDLDPGVNSLATGTFDQKPGGEL